MKLPKRPDFPKRRRSQRHNPQPDQLSQAEIDRQFQEITTGIDHTEISQPGPRDYQLSDELEPDSWRYHTETSDFSDRHQPTWKQCLLGAAVIMLTIWVVISILVPNLPGWTGWIGLIILVTLVTGMWLNLRRGLGPLSSGHNALGSEGLDNFDDEDGARL